MGEAGAAGRTVTVQVAFLPLPSRAVQVIIALPADFAVTSPVEETVAMVVSEDFHDTDLL
ncbi:hypothetical protein SDC9_197522 [bioreactor metagenome]|uniref:Uncharacterized protein n=1 Tax=bioreactor metagenome TaxID=1076179 RepID=A0A645IF20_9ZZZZ